MAKPERAALAIDLLSGLIGDQLPTDIRLFRAGTNRTKKGDFTFDGESVKRVMASAADWGNDYSFDYEHDILNPFIPGHQKMAAGWFRLAVANDELHAVDVRYTDLARQRILAKEVRYVSPLFMHEEGVVTEILNVALTSTPATCNAQPLVPLAGGLLLADDQQGAQTDAPNAPSGTVSFEATPTYDPFLVYDAAENLRRVRSWASRDGSGQPGTLDLELYRKAFAWYDPRSPENLGDYRLLHHDAIAGELVVSRPALIEAGRQVVAGNAVVPEADFESVRTHLAKEFALFGMSPPWDENATKTTATPPRKKFATDKHPRHKPTGRFHRPTK